MASCNLHLMLHKTLLLTLVNGESDSRTTKWSATSSRPALMKLWLLVMLMVVNWLKLE